MADTEKRMNWAKVMQELQDKKKPEKPVPLPRTVFPYTSKDVPQPLPRGLGGARATCSPQSPETPPPEVSPFRFQGLWDELDSDCFVRSDKVKSMNVDNYQMVLAQNDITFVFFYDPNDKRSKTAAQNVRQAAGCTKRASHGYVAVNCAKDESLCTEVGVLSTPFFRVQNGFIISENDSDATKDPDKIRKMVENNKVPTSSIVKSVLN